MLEIDGSQGEGGGQVLRTALSLSALTGLPFVMCNIRAGRSNPGLAPQHLTCVRAAAELCAAKVTGDELQSQQITFEPGQIRAGEFEFDVAASRPSAGSTSLVLQTLLPPLVFARQPSRVTIRGGTNVPWSPPYEYLERVFVPAVQAMGGGKLSVSLQRQRAGWYPRGGGTISAEISPPSSSTVLRPICWLGRPQVESMGIVSTVSQQLPSHILQRQVEGARQRLGELNGEVHIKASTAHVSGGPGTTVLVYLQGRAGYSALGKKGKPAEQVGAEAAEQFMSLWLSGAAVDERLADQLLIYLAIAEGTSEFTTPEITQHLHTNAWVIKQFLPVAVEFGKGPSDVPRVRVHGATITPQEE